MEEGQRDVKAQSVVLVGDAGFCQYRLPYVKSWAKVTRLLYSNVTARDFYIPHFSLSIMNNVSNWVKFMYQYLSHIDVSGHSRFVIRKIKFFFTLATESNRQYNGSTYLTL
jgi:hypothetical protein